MLPLLGLAAVLALAGVVWSTAFRRPAAVPPRLSLIVLPFSNLSADPAQDYLGDIITEELTTALSRLRGSTVISSSSAFTLKGKPVDIKQLGSDLGVSYALEGSVLRSDGSVRINARLVDTQSAKTLWSDQFDVRRAELLQTQDDIVTRLASALHVELVQAETRRATGTAVANLDAEDLAMRCEAASYRRGGAAATPTYDLCERALGVDPRNVRALIQLATYYSSRVSRVQSPNPAADLQRADSLVSRALEIDPGYYAAHCVKAVVLEGTHHVRDAVVAAERCLALNPSYAGAYRILALQYFFLAEPGKLLEYADHGIRLSPRDPETVDFPAAQGLGLFRHGEGRRGPGVAASRGGGVARNSDNTCRARVLTGVDGTRRRGPRDADAISCAPRDADADDHAVGLHSGRQSSFHEISPSVQGAGCARPECRSARQIPGQVQKDICVWKSPIGGP